MDDFKIFLVAMGIGLLLVLGMFYGFDAMAKDECANLATNAQIETRYFRNTCNIKICDVWVNQYDLPYHWVENVMSSNLKHKS